MRQMPELEITVVDVESLVPYANNAKLHDARQIDQIAQSIQEFGNNDPIAVWHNEQGEMEIVEGHGRLMALKKLGIETVEVITLDHLSDKQRRAYALIHNQLTLNTGFDIDILRQELEGIEAFDMDAYGFDLGTVSSDEYTNDAVEDYDAWEDDENIDIIYDETFHCLFICHNDEEAGRLATILGVDKPLKSSYRLSEIIGGE